jgi:hypothetical protein
MSSSYARPVGQLLCYGIQLSTAMADTQRRLLGENRIPLNKELSLATVWKVSKRRLKNHASTMSVE